MRIFELHFNPKLKEDYFFDSFVFEPSHSYEKKLGSLYQVGDLKNALPNNAKFLDNLAKNIKEKYFTLSFKTPEKAISESLKKANEFLGQELKKENVNWLGNLNFAVLSVKNSDLIFTKTGDIKILMIRQGAITDIGKGLEIEKIDPYPLRIFFNIVTGKLIPNDIVLVLTKEIYDYLNQQKILEKLRQERFLNEKKIKEIFPQELFSEKEKTKSSGVCFMITIEEMPAYAKATVGKLSSVPLPTELRKTKQGNKNLKSIFLAKKEAFNLSQIFSPVNDFYKKIIKIIKRFYEHKKQKENPLKTQPKTKSQAQSQATDAIKTLISKNNFILLAIFASIIFIGFLIFQTGENKKNNSLKDIKQKTLEAKNQDSQKAKETLKIAWQEILPLSQKTKNQEIISLKDSIEKDLESLYGFEKIKNPASFYELNPDDLGFPAEKILFSENNIFIFNSGFQTIYNLNLSEEKLESYISNLNCKLGVADSGVFFCFSEPNIISFLKNRKIEEKETQINETSDVSQIYYYNSNIYMLDKNFCEIIKIGFGANNFSYPQIWLKENLKTNCKETKSIATDGSLWVLNSNNSVDVYYKGLFQKTIKIDVFPEIKNLVKIEAKNNAPYLFFLEPGQKRIIITDKEGNIFKQFSSEAFNDLKDFSVSENGKEIYLLNANKIYKIEM